MQKHGTGGRRDRKGSNCPSSLCGLCDLLFKIHILIDSLALSSSPATPAKLVRYNSLLSTPTVPTRLGRLQTRPKRDVPPSVRTSQPFIPAPTGRDSIARVEVQRRPGISDRPCSLSKAPTGARQTKLADSPSTTKCPDHRVRTGAGSRVRVPSRTGSPIHRVRSPSETTE